MFPYLITTRAEYDLAKAHGFEPLIGFERIKGETIFQLEIRLRVAIQRELFGTGHTPEENEKFYRWCWDHYPHICSETMRPLKQYSATYISHIMTRGAHPEMAHDPRNVNILCFEMHNRWENGDRSSMRIYRANLLTVEQLKKEYGKINRNQTVE